MIWRITKKEFLLNLMTFKFAVGTSLCTVLIAVFTPILAEDYQQRLKTYHDNVTRNEAELLKVKVYKNITPTIYRPPSLLAVFSRGLEERLGNSVKIELDRVPEISAAADTIEELGNVSWGPTVPQGNPYLSIYPVFDASLILKIILSVLALLVSYDAVSGEREQGTLRLTLSNTVARHQVLLGKLLAGLMILIVPVTVAFVLGVVILLCFPMVELSGLDWIRIGLMFLVSLVFVSAMYNLGLLFSCLARRSTISLVLGLFVWIVFVIVIPNGSVYVAGRLLPPDTEEKIEGRLAAIREEKSDEISRGPKHRISGSRSDLPGAFGHFYARQCDTTYMEGSQKLHPFKIPLEVKYADKFWEVEHGYLSSLLRQSRLAHNLSRLSPICLYDNAMTALAGTDINSFQSFTKGVRTLRNRIIEYIRSRTDNFSTTSFFMTYIKEETERYEKALNDKRIPPNPPEPPSLELSDLPRFVYKADIAKILRCAIPDLGLLIFANVLFFATAFVAFVRYDIR